MVLSVFDDWYSVPFVKNSQKQSKDSQTAKNDHWFTNRHNMSTQSPPNTQSRANAATSRDLHHMCLGSGHSPSPLDRADSICLHGRPCVCLPFAAVYAATLSSTYTDDACSSSSLSTTIIKFSRPHPLGTPALRASVPRSGPSAPPSSLSACS